MPTETGYWAFKTGPGGSARGFIEHIDQHQMDSIKEGKGFHLGIGDPDVSMERWLVSGFTCAPVVLA